MANTKVDTGHGATMTFGTSSHAFNWTSISLGVRSRPHVDTTHLGSTVVTSMQGDLQDPGEAEVDFQFDPHTAMPATTTTSETVTITLPVAPGGTTGATYAGTALITEVTPPTLQTGQLQMGKMKLRWTGATGPTFTAGVNQ